jgi:ankyrin repeat protein
MWASHIDHTAIVELLLEAGADINANDYVSDTESIRHTCTQKFV